MKIKLVAFFCALFLLSACSKVGKVKSSLESFALDMESKNYKIGEKIILPSEVSSNCKLVQISFGDQLITDLKIDPKYFSMGENMVTIDAELESGEHVSQDVNIKVFASKKETNIGFDVIKEYPHNPLHFVQGYQLENNTIFESTGQLGQSKIMKYPLGSNTASVEKALPNDVFGEGSTIVFDKIYMLSWQNKKGYIFNKSNLELISEFAYPENLKEGWGITFDGENLIVSDGSNNLYFLDYRTPEKLVKYVSVAGYDQSYDQINELEYHDGFVYANIWQQPVIIKINPKTGEVVGKMDLSALSKKNTKGEDDVLNGITFKGENMLVTGKNWPTTYELKWK